MSLKIIILICCFLSGFIFGLLAFNYFYKKQRAAWIKMYREFCSGLTQVRCDISNHLVGEHPQNQNYKFMKEINNKLNKLY
jgi:hypothetical protein